MPGHEVVRTVASQLVVRIAVVERNFGEMVEMASLVVHVARRARATPVLLWLAGMALASSARAQDACEQVQDPCEPRIVRCEYGHFGRGFTVKQLQEELERDGCHLKAGVLDTYGDTSPREPRSGELSKAIIANGLHFRRGALRPAMADYVGVVLSPIGEDVFATREIPAVAAGGDGFDYRAAALGAVLGAVLVGILWLISARRRA